MKEEEVGFVSNYFGKISVAIVEITRGVLKTGDMVHVKGHTTDFQQVVGSMQIEHEPVSEAKKGDSVGLKVEEKGRKKDKVYKVVEE
ncbi:MAG: EF-Tu/IF-2/RF-3 family GTPase [Fidelibacterota bacterium]